MKDKQFKSWTERAKYQNMEVARAKAIAIMEMLANTTNVEGEVWYEYEDEITNIINSK